MIAKGLFVSSVGAVLLVLVCVSAALCCPIHYVKPTGSDTNDGCSWATAKKTVQAGLNSAASGDEVWVAAGTYVERIILKSGGGLYGGFAGTETSRDQRDWTANLTVLDGNNGGIVVFSPVGATASTVIDGFTIRNGSFDYAAGIFCNSSSPTITHNTITANKATLYFGGGIYCEGSFATIAYNTITANTAGDRGGGIFCYSSSPTIAHNTISGNSATRVGGGISCDYYSSPTIVYNTLTGNSADWGGGIACDDHSSPSIDHNAITANSGPLAGGIYCEDSSPTITNSTISGNNASYGGGINCYASSPTIANNTISANIAHLGGGIYCHVSSSPSITNSTISANTAGWGGGGIYCEDSSPTIANNIVAGNSSGVWASGSGVVVLKHNCVHNPADANYSGLSPGEGDLQVDPVFVNGWGGNYHLAGSSPCIDAGDSSVVLPGWVDMDLEPRIAGAQVDIGADEAAPAAVPLPLAGWHIIAQPHQGDHPLRDADPLIMVSHDGGAPVPFCDAVMNGWLQSQMFYYDEASTGYADAGCDPWYDSALREGKGYWLNTFVPNLTLVFP